VCESRVLTLSDRGTPAPAWVPARLRQREPALAVGSGERQAQLVNDGEAMLQASRMLPSPLRVLHAARCQRHAHVSMSQWRPAERGIARTQAAFKINCSHLGMPNRH